MSAERHQELYTDARSLCPNQPRGRVAGATRQRTACGLTISWSIGHHSTVGANISSFSWLSQMACGALVPGLGGPLAWQWGVLTTGPPGKSLCALKNNNNNIVHYHCKSKLALSYFKILQDSRQKRHHTVLIDHMYLLDDLKRYRLHRCTVNLITSLFAEMEFHRPFWSSLKGG